jgi:hypothetical protein
VHIAQYILSPPLNSWGPWVHYGGPFAHFWASSVALWDGPLISILPFAGRYTNEYWIKMEWPLVGRNGSSWTKNLSRRRSIHHQPQMDSPGDEPRSPRWDSVHQVCVALVLRFFHTSGHKLLFTRWWSWRRLKFANKRLRTLASWFFRQMEPHCS